MQYIRDFISTYSTDLVESKTRSYAQGQKNFPEATEEELDSVLGWSR